MILFSPTYLVILFSSREEDIYVEVLVEFGTSYIRRIQLSGDIIEYET